MVAKTTKSRKAKSRKLQNLVAEDLRAKYNMDENDIAPAIMGTRGIDIRLSNRARKVFPYGVECKNEEKISIWGALRQCEFNAAKEKLTPLLVIKKNHMDPYAVIPRDVFSDNFNEFGHRYQVDLEVEKISIWKEIQRCEKEAEGWFPLLTIKRSTTKMYVVIKWSEFIGTTHHYDNIKEVNLYA